MKLSVIIVNYNVEYFLEQCLQSVFNAAKNIETEVYVVDNQSVDGSLQMLAQKFPQVHVIANSENVGFAKANNQAISVARGEYVLLLNPDTLVEEETFEKALAFMDKTADAGALGVKMINGNGEFLPESKRGLPVPSVAFYKIFGLAKFFPKSKKFGYYHLTYLDNAEINPVEVLSGAFMLIRNEILQKIGGLDESYFMYGEDIDLSYRITQEGYKNYYFPETQIIHYKGESTKKSSLNYVLVFYKAMQIFAKKHFSKSNTLFFNALINSAIWFRAALAMLKRIALTLLLPLLDFAVIFAGMVGFTAYWEDNVLFLQQKIFPDYYLLLVLPLYTLVWILAIALHKGYRKPIQLSRTNRGIILGTVALFLIYALLPESVRFSRAVLVFGAMWTAIAINTLRYLWRKVHFNEVKFRDRATSRFLVIGDRAEGDRVVQLVRATTIHIDFLRTITTDSAEPKSEFCIGDVSELRNLVAVHQVKALVFCSKCLTIKQITELMERFRGQQIEFKIAPENAVSVIGSHSIKTANDLLETPASRKLLAKNVQKKRRFDLFSALFLLLFLWIDLWFVKNRSAFPSKIWSVLCGKKSWIGYTGSRTEGDKLPLLPSGVLTTAAAFGLENPSQDVVNQADSSYIRNFKTSKELFLLLKNFKNL